MPEDFPGGTVINAYGQRWYFSQQALDALRAVSPITKASLGFCAKKLNESVSDLDKYFEVEYFRIPLRGKRDDGMVWIDAKVIHAE